jgi:hypothetical protein
MKNKGTISDIFKSKGSVKALIITSGLFALQQLAGINVILFYSQSIFDEAKISIEPAIASILVGKFY